MNTTTYPQSNTGSPLVGVTPAHVPVKALAQGFVDLMKRVADRVRRARARAVRRAAARETYHLMREMSAHTLRDLGIDRSELYSLALETHGEQETTRRLRGIPDFPSNRTHDIGAFDACRF